MNFLFNWIDFCYFVFGINFNWFCYVIGYGFNGNFVLLLGDCFGDDEKK